MAKKKKAAKKKAPPKKKKAPAKKKKKAPAAKKKAAEHPSLTWLRDRIPPGRYAGGTLLVVEPGGHDAEMGPWLLGNTDGRTSLGRTAFGEILVFRDLRDRARALGLPGADDACDVALIDVHYRRMTMIADSAAAFVDSLEDPEWQRAFLRRDLYDQARTRLGELADDELYAFVPALALGGSEDAASLERCNWQVHQEILRQLAT
jgi:hypothetical protein